MPFAADTRADDLALTSVAISRNTRAASEASTSNRVLFRCP